MNIKVSCVLLIFKCSDCGVSFAWSPGEQKFYSEHGLEPPKRCPTCRRIKRERFTEVSK